MRERLFHALPLFVSGLHPDLSRTVQSGFDKAAGMEHNRYENAGDVPWIRFKTLEREIVKMTPGKLWICRSRAIRVKSHE